MDSGKKVPTVREGLKRVSPVVVVDAQSPATGAEYLEGRIASARKFRGQIPELIKQPETPRREAYVFLDRLIFPNGDINKKVLTHHDIASYHLLHDGIYDYPYLSRHLVQPDDSTPSLMDRKSPEDKGDAANGASKSGDVVQGLPVPKLCAEAITFHPVKTVQVKGFSKWKG